MELINALKNSVVKLDSFGTATGLSHELYIGYGIDAAFVRPLGVNITSLALNNPDTKLNLHVFVSSIQTMDIERLKQLAEMYNNIVINLYSINDSIFKEFPTKVNLPIATYFRFLIPATLADIDYYLYMDADILCLRSINDLLRIELGDAVAATVPDANSKRAKELGITSKYFNAGVMWVDIKKWNKEDISTKAINILLENPDKYTLLDQDVLNIVLQDRIKSLSSMWNQMYIKHEKVAVFPDTILLHYAGRTKPWKCACSSNEQQIYLDYEQKSLWAGLPLDLPANHKEARSYAKVLLKKQHYAHGLKWYYKYLQMKFYKTN